VRIILDQGLPRTACLYLQEMGHDVVHVSNVGLSHAKDIGTLEYSRVERCRLSHAISYFKGEIPFSYSNQRGGIEG
jgi:predicted nuclease of predicted toxin-antitoxin system